MLTCVESHSGVFYFLNEVLSHFHNANDSATNSFLSHQSTVSLIDEFCANCSMWEHEWCSPVNIRIYPQKSSPPLLLLSFHPHIVSLTSHVHLAIIMKLKLFSVADVCPGNKHTEIGFIHLAF